MKHPGFADITTAAWTDEFDCICAIASMTSSITGLFKTLTCQQTSIIKLTYSLIKAKLRALMSYRIV